MFCIKCGTKLPDDAKFCFKCGNNVINSIMQQDISKEGQKCEINVFGNSVILLGEKLQLPPNVDIAGYLILQFTDFSKKSYNIYYEMCSHYKNLDYFISNQDKDFDGILYSVYNFCLQFLNKNGIYSYDIDSIALYMQKYIGIWNASYEMIYEQYCKLKNQEQIERDFSDYKNRSRSRLIGGGFGIKGAAKGIAIAGTVNAITGVFSSVSNSISKLSVSNRITKGMNNIINDEDVKKHMSSSIAEDTFKVMYGLINLHNQNVNGRDEIPIILDGESVKKADNIYNSIVADKVEDKRIKSSVIDILCLNPIESKYYYLALNLYPEYAKELESYARKYSYDIKNLILEKDKELRTVNGKEYDTAEEAKLVEKEIKIIHDTIDRHKNSWNKERAKKCVELLNSMGLIHPESKCIISKIEKLISIFEKKQESPDGIFGRELHRCCSAVYFGDNFELSYIDNLEIDVYSETLDESIIYNNYEIKIVNIKNDRLDNLIITDRHIFYGKNDNYIVYNIENISCVDFIDTLYNEKLIFYFNNGQENAYIDCYITPNELALQTVQQKFGVAKYKIVYKLAEFINIVLCLVRDEDILQKPYYRWNITGNPYYLVKTKEEVFTEKFIELCKEKLDSSYISYIGKPSFNDSIKILSAKLTINKNECVIAIGVSSLKANIPCFAITDKAIYIKKANEDWWIYSLNEIKSVEVVNNIINIKIAIGNKDIKFYGFCDVDNNKFSDTLSESLNYMKKYIPEKEVYINGEKADYQEYNRRYSDTIELDLESEFIKKKLHDYLKDPDEIFVYKFRELLGEGFLNDKFYTVNHVNFSNALSKATCIYDQEKYPEENAIAVYDSTVFGSGKNGMVITDKAIYTKTANREPVKVLLDTVKNIDTKPNIISIQTFDSSYKIVEIKRNNDKLADYLLVAINAKRDYLKERKAKLEEIIKPLSVPFFAGKFLEYSCYGIPEDHLYTIYHWKFNQIIEKADGIYDSEKYPNEKILAIFDANDKVDSKEGIVLTDQCFYFKEPNDKSYRIDIYDILSIQIIGTQNLIIKTINNNEYKVTIDFKGPISNVQYAINIINSNGIRKNLVHDTIYKYLYK